MLLITGATGLLGGHLLYELLQHHERVAALKRASSQTDTLREIFSFYGSDPKALLQRIDWRTGDLLDIDSLIGALEGIDCVINCAAVVSFDGRDSSLMTAANVRGARNLAEACRQKTEDGRRKTEDRRPGDRETERRGEGAGVSDGELKIRLIHISSIAALGDGPGDNPDFLIDEETPRDPSRKRSGYSRSKFESEKILLQSGLPCVILNPGVILGPCQWEKGSSLLFAKAWKGIKYYPYGGTGYVDVRDLAGIIVQMAEQLSVAGYPFSPSTGAEVLSSSLHGERFCIVGANLRYRELFNMVSDEAGLPNPSVYAGRFITEIAWRAESVRAMLTGRSPQLTREAARAAQRISYYSSDKIIKTLGIRFRPIEETIAWMGEGRRRTEDGRRKTEDGRQKTEDRRQRD